MTGGGKRDCRAALAMTVLEIASLRSQWQCWRLLRFARNDGGQSLRGVERRGSLNDGRLHSQWRKRDCRAALAM